MQTSSGCTPCVQPAPCGTLYIMQISSGCTPWVQACSVCGIIHSRDLMRAHNVGAGQFHVMQTRVTVKSDEAAMQVEVYTQRPVGWLNAISMHIQPSACYIPAHIGFSVIYPCTDNCSVCYIYAQTAFCVLYSCTCRYHRDIYQCSERCPAWYIHEQTSFFVLYSCTYKCQRNIYPCTQSCLAWCILLTYLLIA